jgi:hypothetical protein
LLCLFAAISFSFELALNAGVAHADEVHVRFVFWFSGRDFGSHHRSIIISGSQSCKSLETVKFCQAVDGALKHVLVFIEFVEHLSDEGNEACFEMIF